MIASPANIVQGTWRISFAHRNKFKRVKARIYDHKKAKQVEIEAESDEEGTADYTIPEPFADEGEAKNAAKAKADKLKSETIRTEVTVFGDPTIRAGAPFTYSSVWPGIDGIEFIIESATHEINKAGYTTRISAKLKPEQKTRTSGSKGTGGTDDNTAPPPAAPTVPDPTPPSIPGGIGHA